jgi:glycosidase
MQRAVISAEWWRQPVIYQVNPPSFAASAPAGGSMLRAVMAQTGYLAALGVDAVWLSPFDPAALADDGSVGEADEADVANEAGEAGDAYAAGGGPDGDGGLPPVGTLADFDELTAGLDAHGIKVIVDLIPNAPAFDFELLEADWDAGEFLHGIADRRLGLPDRGTPATWVLSSQDTSPRRARAAALLMLALPGSAFLPQGEELGLHELTDITPSIRAQEHDPGSTLNLYRQALSWRRKLQAAPHLEWMPGTGRQVLHFRRPGGWRSVTNFGSRPVPLPPGTVVAASAPLDGTGLDSAMLPHDTTAWIISAG